MGVHLYSNGAWMDSGKIYRNSLNIFNSEIVQGGIANTGEIITSQLRVRSFQTLESGQEYTISTNKRIRLLFAFYDTTPISLLADYGSTPPPTLTITMPINANNLGIALCNPDPTTQIHPDDDIQIMLNTGSIVLPYEPYNVVDWYTNNGHGYSSGAWS